MFRRRNNAAVATPTKLNPLGVVAPSATTAAATTAISSNPDVRMANGTVIADRYRLEKTIGKGSYGKVKLASDLSTGSRVAVKFIARSSIKKPAHTTRIRREINLLTALYHPRIVRLYQTVETSHDIILVLEYVEGADLFERIVGHADKRYGEAEGRTIFAQLVEAIEYCHQHRMIHRDLKPENVMVGLDGSVKLIDFGFANLYHPRGYLETNCGSPLYAAPEIVQGVRYVGPEVDVWSLGVILFAILTGTLPFEDEQLKGLYAKICAGSYTIPTFLSAGAKDLLRKMLCVDPAKRLTIGQVASHPWVHHLTLPPRHPLYLRPNTVAHPSEQLLQMMTSFGFTNVDETRFTVATDPDDPATSIYYLLRERQERETLTIDKGPASIEASSPLNGLMTPPATPAKLFSPVKVAPATLSAASRRNDSLRPLCFPATPPEAGSTNPWTLMGPSGGHVSPPSLGRFHHDLATPVIVAPPMQHVTGSRVSSLHPAPSDGTSGRKGGESEVTESTSLFTTPANIVTQAAASVANHFKRLRGLAFIPRSGDATAGITRDQRISRDHRMVPEPYGSHQREGGGDERGHQPV